MSTKVIGACNRFNRHYPVKGMPRGIYAADDHEHTKRNSAMFYFFGVASVLLVFGGVGAAMRFRMRGVWQPVSGSDALVDMVN